MECAVDEGVVRAALHSVQDPEAGLDIVDLGLVYRIVSRPGQVRVEMTLTSRACPMGSYLADEAAAAVRAVVPEATEVQIEMVWDPPWTPERMSAAALARLGWPGA